MRAIQVKRSRRATSRAAGFWLVAAAFAVTMLGTTLPTPLYVLYQRGLGFSTSTSTVIFAVYAVGVLAALLVLGGVSDAIGRRPTLLTGLACAAVSGFVFIGAHDLPLLMVGRLLSGLSAGIFTGTATATLVDLADDAERATLVGTVANMGGLGAGPLLSGLLVQLAPVPLLMPFIVHLALLALVCVGIWTMPEPVVVRHARLPRMARPNIPEAVRAPFVRVAIAGFAGFAVLGLFAAVAPLFLSTLLRVSAPAPTGAVVCGVFAASAVGQVALARRLQRNALPIGCAILVTGMLTMAVALAVGSLPLLLLATALSGVGQGVSFRAGLAAINAAAPAEHRAEVASAFFLVAYVAISVPVVGEGLAAQAAGLRAAGIGFSLAIAALAATGAIQAARTRTPRVAMN